MKILKILSFSISLALLVSGSVFGATIKVPDDYTTIQQAINAVVDGDTVIVAPDTYNEGIDFIGKKITVRSQAGPELTIINTTSFIRFTTGETKETLLEGFKIIGGIDIFNGSSPQIKNCNLIGVGTHGDGGHGSIGSGSSPTFINCRIYGGRASIGGGYDIRGDSSTTFINCEFSDNKAGSNGGAIYINNSSVRLENCAFLHNSADDEGGAIFVTGSSILSISFCNFSENNAQVGGSIINGYKDNTTIVNSTFTKNSAQKWGGAIFTNASDSFTTRSCIFTENHANWHGGAIHINWSASPTIINSIFDENIADSGGGAIWIQPGSFSNITNCTFFKNSAGWKGGAILNSGSNPTISNCILWDDTAPRGPEIGKYVDDDPDPTVNHCDIQGGYPGDDNIDADPLFVEPENSDYHLQYISPCVDAGTNDALELTLTDLDGNPRIINGIVDMGAYESKLTNVNNYFSFEPDPGTFSFIPDTTDCQAGAVGKFSFDATLTNISKKTLSNLYVEVDELTNNNLLLTDNGLIGKSERFEVSKHGDYTDGYLSHEENVDVPFTVCLKDIKPFQFYVDVLGVSTGLNEGIIAYYPFNGNADDESGNEHDGTVLGDTALAEDRFGNTESAYSFDGDGDYIKIGQRPDFPSWGMYSVSVWFMNDGGGDNTSGYGQKIIDKTVWYHDWYLRVYTYPGAPDPIPGTLGWVTYEGGPKAIALINMNYDYRDNLWHHVVIKKTGSYGELWVDGNLIESSNDIKTVYSYGDLLIGYSHSGDFFQRKYWSGKIDDIRIYNRVLSAAEIEALYNLSNYSLYRIT